eukprot:869389-Prymnesium_polylepis.2
MKKNRHHALEIRTHDHMQVDAAARAQSSRCRAPAIQQIQCIWTQQRYSRSVPIQQIQQNRCGHTVADTADTADTADPARPKPTS